MKAVHLADLDLNLLRVLDALLVERHLTRAARRVGLSQPAMSHALSRLRARFGDPLFVRTPQGLVPTARAEQVEGPLRESLAAIARCLEGGARFDAAAATRAFTVATADYGSFVLAPSLIARITRDAPGVDLWVRTIADDPFAQLARGDADMVLGPVRERDAPGGVHGRTLYEERFVCLVRDGHPRVKKKLDLDAYTELPHLFVAPRGTPGGVVDRVLAEHGRRRRVAVAVPHFLLAPHLIATSDMVLTIGSRVAEAFCAMLPLKVFAPPVEIPGFSVRMLWHDRQHHDPAQQWLRAQVLDVTREAERKVKAK